MKKATPVQINWKPDKNNPVPLYQQIVDYIYQKISSGDWPVGTRLPSQRTLAEQFDVNVWNYPERTWCRNAGN